MSLAAGAMLGPYEVVGPLSAGKEIGQRMNSYRKVRYCALSSALFRRVKVPLALK